MTDKPVHECEVCGSLMPPGEEMFRYHGYSGPCPAPPKEIWIVLDDEGWPIYCAGWPEACHEHINDAINEHDIDGAEKWTVRRAELTPSAK